MDEAIAITRLTEPDPDLPPLAEPAAARRRRPPLRRHRRRPRPKSAPRAVAEAIRDGRSRGPDRRRHLLDRRGRSSALMNSRGVSACHAETHGALLDHRHGRRQFRLGEGQRLRPSRARPGRARASRAAQKRAESARPARVARRAATPSFSNPPPCSTSPARCSRDFSATAIRDGRSFLNDRIGKKLFGENITIHDDARHPLQSGAPFDGEGVPRKRADAGGQRRGRARSPTAGRPPPWPASRRPATAFPLPNEIGEAPDQHRDRRRRHARSSR